MATTNLNLNTLAGTEKLKSFPTPYNDNMTAIDDAFGSGFGVGNNSSVDDELNGLGNGMAIIANGNTHAAITSGQYVYVRQHGSLSEGLYKATANISANGTLSGSNLTAVSSGGLNDVYSELNSEIITNYNESVYWQAGDTWTPNVNWTIYPAMYRSGSKLLYITVFTNKIIGSDRTLSISNRGGNIRKLDGTNLISFDSNNLTVTPKRNGANEIMLEIESSSALSLSDYEVCYLFGRFNIIFG